MKNKFKVLCGAVALVIAGQVSATTTWTLSTGTVSGVGDSPSVTAASTGWANTGGSTTSGTDATNLQLQPAGTNLRIYSGGLGINNLDGCTSASGTTCDVGDTSGAAPEHAIDNNSRYEMVLLTFSQLVNLSGVKFGWTGKADYGSGWDSDFTVMAYDSTKVGATTSSLIGKTWGALDAGWVGIGNYADGVKTTSNSVNAGGVYSSLWLVGAYNPLVGAPNQGSGTSDKGNDALKLASVVGTVCTSGTGPSCTPLGKVPEPGSLALAGLGLLGMFGFRRRQPVRF